jgi:hypothetical protein
LDFFVIALAPLQHAREERSDATCERQQRPTDPTSEEKRDNQTVPEQDKEKGAKEGERNEGETGRGKE